MISIGIVAHYSRHERATRLADIVGAEVVAVDQGGMGAGSNHEVCYDWLAESQSAWTVVLEDDAMPVRGFVGQLEQVLRAAPSPLVSLYLGRGRPPHWQIPIAQVITQDANFLLGSELLHHVAVAIRTPLVPGMLRFIRADPDYAAGKLPIDEAIGRWARQAAKVPVSYAHPSIVNHNHDLPTVIKRHLSQHRTEDGKRGRKHIRRAWAFGTRPQWGQTTAVIPDPVVA